MSLCDWLFMPGWLQTDVHVILGKNILLMWCLFKQKPSIKIKLSSILACVW